MEEIPFPSCFNQGYIKKPLPQKSALLVNEVVTVGPHQLMQQTLKLRTDRVELAIIVVNQSEAQTETTAETCIQINIYLYVCYQ